MNKAELRPTENHHPGNVEPDEKERQGGDLIIKPRDVINPVEVVEKAILGQLPENRGHDPSDHGAAETNFRRRHKNVHQGKGEKGEKGREVW